MNPTISQRGSARHSDRGASHGLSSRNLPGRLEQLDRIAVWIFQLDLLSRRAGLHLVAKMQPRLLQRLDSPRKVGHAKDHAVPPARFLTMPVGHRARPRRPGPADQKLEIAERYVGERRKLLMLQL